MYAARENPAHRVHRDLNWMLPREIKSFVTSVSDTNTLPGELACAGFGCSRCSASTVPPSIARRAFRMSKERQSGNVSPSLLTSFYRITVSGVPSANSTLSLFESLGQSFSPSDLTAFQSSYNLPQVPVANVVGANQPSACSDDPNNCGEANLDVQWAFAVTQNVSLTYWSVSGEWLLGGGVALFCDWGAAAARRQRRHLLGALCCSPPTTPFSAAVQSWIEAVTATPNPPLIHSLSYGSLAPEDPKIDVVTFNTDMCKLGLKGLTLFVATGDDGVANFGARGAPSQCGFTPSFPATSPYAVAVGATQGPEVERARLRVATRLLTRPSRALAPGWTARDCLHVLHQRPHHHWRCVRACARALCSVLMPVRHKAASPPT